MEITQASITGLHQEISDILNAYDAELDAIRETVSDCTATCAALEDQAAEAEGEALAAIQESWWRAQADKRFAENRLDNFLAEYPDSAAYFEAVGGETLARFQEFDQAVMDRLTALEGESATLWQSIENKKAEYLALDEAISDLGEEIDTVIALGTTARSQLRPSDRVKVVDPPSMQPVTDAFRLDATASRLGSHTWDAETRTVGAA